MSSLTMYDTIYNNQFPSGAQAYAAYVDGGLGDQPNYAWIVKAFPKADHLSIALDPAHDADALDIENGAATPQDAAGWHERQKARGVARPCFYASASTMEADILPVITAAKFPRAGVRLWSAHYGAGEHICGPSTCKLVSVAMDGTQWTSSALGRDLDQSLLLPDFFTVPHLPAPAGPSHTCYVTAVSVNFGWKPVPGATSYHFQLLQGGKVIVDETTTDTFVHGVPTLKPGTGYAWRVSALNDGLWTAEQAFTTP